MFNLEMLNKISFDKIYKNWNDQTFYQLLNNIITSFWNKNIKNEKELQKSLKEWLSNYLLNLEEYEEVKSEITIFRKKRIDLVFNLSFFQYWIELKYWINTNSIRTLEYQINEYTKNITYKYIIILIKLKSNETIKNFLSIEYLIKRLLNKNNVLLFFIW